MNKVLAVILLLAAAAANAEGQLHPADAYDIKSGAEFAAMREFIKAGDPVKKADGYEVPVSVKGVPCKVVVKPHTPGPMDPPTRWKATAPSCSK